MSMDHRQLAYVGKSHQEMLDYEVLSRVDWRPGDLVISGPPKSGTNWVQQMVHQLRTGGDTDFLSIRAVVPVIGHVKVNLTREQELAQLAQHPSPRALKTHFAPPVLPFRPELRYLVVVRDVLEIPVSLLHFSNAFSPASKARTGMPTYRDLHHLMEDFDDLSFYFAFLNAWFAVAGAPNVLFLHYRDMKADLPGTLERIAAFGGLPLAGEESLARITHLCSFDWMKAHQIKFETNWDGTPMVSTGNLIRRGDVGENQRALPEDLRARLEAKRAALLPARFQGWVVSGGAFPS